jgi:hypothetical protein
MASPKKKRLRYLLDLPGASPVNGYIKGGLKTEQEEAEAAHLAKEAEAVCLVKEEEEKTRLKAEKKAKAALKTEEKAVLAKKPTKKTTRQVRGK